MNIIFHQPKQLVEALQKQMAGSKKKAPIVSDDATLITQLKKQNEALQSELDRVIAVNTELQKQLAITPVQKAPEPSNTDLIKLSFVNNGTTYGFNFPKARMDGKDITADMVVSDVELQNKLISRSSGMIFKK